MSLDGWFPETFPHTEEFSKAGFDVKHLPVLELKGNVGNHITGIKNDHMTHPVMRFQDNIGRHGVVISVRFRGEMLYEDSELEPHPKIKYSTGRIIYHERVPGRFWVINSNDDNPFCQILRMFDYIHNNYQDHVGSAIDSCDLCPHLSNYFNRSFLVKLLKNQLPYVRVELLKPEETKEHKQQVEALGIQFITQSQLSASGSKVSS